MWLSRKIGAVAAMGMKTSLTYVASVWATVFVNILQVMVFYYIWVAVYGGKTSIKGISLEEMITYVILTRILFTGISFGVNNWMSHQIQTGAISMELLRPIDYQLSLYASRLGDVIIFFFLNGIPVLLISYFLFNVQMPVSFENGVWFLISVLLAITIAFLFEFIVGLCSFYTTNGWGLQVLKEAIINFFSGAIVPLVFFPGVLKSIVEVLPFKDMVYTPISIYLGFVEGNQLFYSIGNQFLWIIGLLIFSRFFFKQALKKIIVQGG